MHNTPTGPTRNTENMTTDEINASADIILKMMEHEGWKVIENWIRGRVDMLSRKVIAGKSDVSVQSCEKSKNGKIEITVVNVNSDYEKHEMQVWNMFLRKVHDFEKISTENKEKK